MAGKEILCRNAIFIKHSQKRFWAYVLLIKILNYFNWLQKEGLLIPAIRYPTVAKGAARLRASLMATHTHDELQWAAGVIAKAVCGEHRARI